MSGESPLEGSGAAPDEETLALAHALFDAAREGNSALLGGYLAAGAPATLTTSSGDSLLMLAAYHGHAGTVRLILDHGGDANSPNDRGQTPLAGAVFKGYTDVARELLEGGADPDAGTPTARAAAQMFARTEILALLGCQGPTSPDKARPGRGSGPARADQGKIALKYSTWNNRGGVIASLDRRGNGTMARVSALTPLGVAALSLLVEEPMHPYEMYQLLIARHEDRLVKVRPGTLYHAVGRLEEQGLVAATGTDRGGNRPERTTYTISAAGREAFTNWLQDMLAAPVNEYPSFPLAISEAYNLPAGVVVELFERRLLALQEQLDVLVAGEELLKKKGVERKYWVDVQYQQCTLQTEIAWIRSLQDQLRSGELPW